MKNIQLDDQLRLIEELQQENTQLKKECDVFTERRLVYQNSFKQYEETIKEMEEERTELRDRIVKLEKLLENNKTLDDGIQSTKEGQCVLHDDRQNQIATKYQEKKQSVSCDSGICMNSHLIKEELEKPVDSVIKENTHEIKHQLPIRNAISHKRENNLIIHGMVEDISFCDEDKVQDIFDAIKVKYEPMTMFRLGKKEENKNRPLMVRLISKEAKETVLSKLGRLKYAVR